MTMVGRDVLSGAPESLKSSRGALLNKDEIALAEGRAFRAYHRFSANEVLKLVFANPFRLTLQSLWTGQGAAEVQVTTGDTEGGVFSELLTKFNKNTQTGGAGSTQAFYGGTATGGIERELLLADSGSAGGGVGSPSTQAGDRMLAAGTYYLHINVSGTTYGIYALEWVESSI